MHSGHLAWWECHGVDAEPILHLKKHRLTGGRFSGNEPAYCSWTLFFIEIIDVGMKSAATM